MIGTTLRRARIIIDRGGELSLMMITCRCDMNERGYLSHEIQSRSERVELFGAGAGCELPYLGGVVDED